MLLASAGGCDRGSPAFEADTASAPLHIVATDPRPEERGVPRDTSLRVRVDRFLRPESAIRQSVRITGGTINADGSSAAGDVFLQPFYDPVDRVVTFRLPDGQLWVPNTRYTVTLWKASDNPAVRPNGLSVAQAGLHAFDGAELDRTVAFGFTTGEARVGALPRPTVVYCNVCQDGAVVVGARQVLGESCGTAACHDGARPAMGLALTTYEGLLATAIQKPAHETLTGPESVDAATNPARFGVAMPNIDPTSPGNSYLIFKLLARTDGWSTTTGSVATPLADSLAGSPVPSASEVERLHDAFVLGDSAPADHTVGIERMRLLSTWIASGAPTMADAACPDVSACAPTGGR